MNHGNNIKLSKGVERILDKEQMQQYGVSSSTQIHNQVANSMCSKRKKIRITTCNMQDRKARIRDRLRQKLQKKKQQK